MPFLADRAAVAVKGMALFGQRFVPYFLFLFHSLARLVSAPKQRLF